MDIFEKIRAKKLAGRMYIGDSDGGIVVLARVRHIDGYWTDAYVDITCFKSFMVFWRRQRLWRRCLDFIQGKPEKRESCEK